MGDDRQTTTKRKAGDEDVGHDAVTVSSWDDDDDDDDDDDAEW